MLIETTSPVLPTTVDIRPIDSRCKNWRKRINRDAEIPMPDRAGDSHNIPGAYLRGHDLELFAGDAVVCGDETHHRKARGWNYRLRVVAADGVAVDIHPKESKARIKTAMAEGRVSLPVDVLQGVGDIAALIRVVWALRAGMIPADFVTSPVR